MWKQLFQGQTKHTTYRLTNNDIRYFQMIAPFFAFMYKYHLEIVSRRMSIPNQQMKSTAEFVNNPTLKWSGFAIKLSQVGGSHIHVDNTELTTKARYFESIWSSDKHYVQCKWTKLHVYILKK